MAVTRRLESRLRSLNLIVTFVVIYFNMWRFLKQWKQHSHSPEILKMWSAFSVLSILTQNFVQILILLNEIKIFKIWPKFFISRVILKLHKKGRPHFGNAWISGVLWLLTKIRLTNKASNYFQSQRRSSSRLVTLMFRGTPCIYQAEPDSRRRTPCIYHAEPDSRRRTPCIYHAELDSRRRTPCIYHAELDSRRRSPCIYQA